MPISLKSMRGCASPAATAICTAAAAAAGTPRLSHRRLNAFNETASYKNTTTPHRRSAAEVGEYLRRRKSSEIRRSPPGSSRYLLGETASFRKDEDRKCSLALVASEPVEVGPTGGRRDDSVRSSPVYRRDLSTSRALVSSQPMVKHRNQGSGGVVAHRRPGSHERGIVKSSSPPTQSGHQVVVLRVSLHCRGCEGKLRKHLAKMEGVTSFSIDLETKKVTVVGNVTPLGVLGSISKVKNAQFWPSPVTSAASSLSSSSSSGLSRSETGY